MTEQQHKRFLRAYRSGDDSPTARRAPVLLLFGDEIVAAIQEAADLLTREVAGHLTQHGVDSSLEEASPDLGVYEDAAR